MVYPMRGPTHPLRTADVKHGPFWERLSQCMRLQDSWVLWPSYGMDSMFSSWLLVMIRSDINLAAIELLQIDCWVCVWYPHDG